MLGEDEKALEPLLRAVSSQGGGLGPVFEFPLLGLKGIYHYWSLFFVKAA